MSLKALSVVSHKIAINRNQFYAVAARWPVSLRAQHIRRVPRRGCCLRELFWKFVLQSSCGKRVWIVCQKREGCEADKQEPFDTSGTERIKVIVPDGTVCLMDSNNKHLVAWKYQVDFPSFNVLLFSLLKSGEAFQKNTI